MPQDQAVIEDAAPAEAPSARRLRTPLPAAEALSRLDQASRRGRLPGFEASAEGSGFRTLLYGEPFDHDLLARFEPSGDGTIIAFEIRPRLRLPIIFAIVILLAVWPGLPLTDSLLATYFSAYPNQMWVTAAWYLPLTLLPLPWMLRRMWRRSRESAREEAVERIRVIERELGAAAE